MRAICIRVWAGAVLIAATSGFAWAQRPLVYPLRSQSPGAQSVDNALCYWQAKQQTSVDIVREPQRPLRATAIGFAPDSGRGTSAPPLPPGADRTNSASAGAAAASGASAAPPAAAASAQTQAQAPSSPGASDTSGASETTALNAASGASGVMLPPLPPPEPPMTRYWQAYGDCMQGRGYGVR